MKVTLAAFSILAATGSANASDASAEFERKLEPDSVSLWTNIVSLS